MLQTEGYTPSPSWLTLWFLPSLTVDFDLLLSEWMPFHQHDWGSRYACENVNKLLVGNKSDLEAKRAVTTEEAKVSRCSNTTQILLSLPTLCWCGDRLWVCSKGEIGGRAFNLFPAFSRYGFRLSLGCWRARFNTRPSVVEIDVSYMLLKE